MENLLKNKQILHSLLHQGDFANVINGGISETYVSSEQEEEKVLINIYASGVNSQDFKIALNKNHLIVSRHLSKNENIKGIERLLVPLFIKSFELPDNIFREGIEAFYEEGLLKIVLPLQNRQNLNREINIQEV